MLYKIAHLLQDKLPCIWNMVEWANSTLFVLRYGRKLKCIKSILEEHSNVYILRQALLSDSDNIVRFFQEQPNDSYKYFRPHDFDLITIKRLIKRKSYLFFIVLDNEKVIGYYFLRCFFIGKCYLGKLLDKDYQGKGIGKTMCLSSMEVASHIGLHMYETISKDNLASLYSSQRVLDIQIIEEMDNNYLYVEDFPKGTLTK